MFWDNSFNIYGCKTKVIVPLFFAGMFVKFLFAEAVAVESLDCVSEKSFFFGSHIYSVYLSLLIRQSGRGHFKSLPFDFLTAFFSIISFLLYGLKFIKYTFMSHRVA